MPYDFALDYPDRCKGLILYSSVMPFSEKLEKTSGYAGPPPFLYNDYMMFLLSPFFEPIMGMPPSTIYTIMPIGERKTGVDIDSRLTNLDIAISYDSYVIESLKPPLLIIHAKDDKLAPYSSVQSAFQRFPSYTLLSLDKGGHLMSGNGDKVKEAVVEFIER